MESNCFVCGAFWTKFEFFVVSWSFTIVTWWLLDFKAKFLDFCIKILSLIEISYYWCLLALYPSLLIKLPDIVLLCSKLFFLSDYYTIDDVLLFYDSESLSNWLKVVRSLTWDRLPFWINWRDFCGKLTYWDTLFWEAETDSGLFGR